MNIQSWRRQIVETNRSSALVYMVRIPDSHSGGPGSIPGCGTFFSFTFLIPFYFHSLSAHCSGTVSNKFGCINLNKVLFRKSKYSRCCKTRPLSTLNWPVVSNNYKPKWNPCSSKSFRFSTTLSSWTKKGVMRWWDRTRNKGWNWGRWYRSRN